ncbi:MAG: helix-turn-helix transcriptional regulator, partial [Blautia sp.]|nr:helix-turn-helix transcriptional regulator [Blautia sp.]
EDSVLVFYMIRSSTFAHVFWNQLGEENLLSKFFHKALSGQSPASYLYFDTGEDEEVRHLLTRIYEEHQEEAPYAAQMLNALMRVAFLFILRKYEGTAKLPRTADFYWKSEFSAIFSYIQNHFAEASREEVAEQFHYSARQVGRIVKEYTGKNYGELIRDLKMNKACELLLMGGHTAEDISSLTGYSAVSSFYRAFSEYFGCTPMAWLEKRMAGQREKAEG